MTPIRVTEAGEALPASAHFKRRKRSADQDTDPGHWESEHVHYRLNAFGRDYRLNLTLEAGFIAPLYTVSVLGARNRTHEEEEQDEDEDETVYRHCFYKGHVNGETEHAAVISLCSGLVSGKKKNFFLFGKKKGNARAQKKRKEKKSNPTERRSVFICT